MKSDMRIVLTKRLLREGLLRLLEEKPISKITVTALCNESGVNRATFYNHYDMPVMILREIAYEYAEGMKNIYIKRKETHGKLAALEASLEYIYKQKAEIKLLFSENAENCISGFGFEIMSRFVSENKGFLRDRTKNDDTVGYLYAVLMSSAYYGLMSTWLTKDIDKSPREIVELLYEAFGDNLFY